MLKRAMVLAGLGFACASNHQKVSLEIENLTNQVAAIQREVDDIHRQLVAASTPTLDQKLDELTRKVDQLARNTPKAPRNEPDRAKVYAIPVDGHPSQGAKDALVTMVVARDYACPFSEKNRSTLDDLRMKYGGDLRIVYRQMIVHPQISTAAALASCAAARQGQFEAIDRALWDEGFLRRAYDKTDPSGASCWRSSEGCPVVLSFAKSAHLDLARFKTDMEACEAPIHADMAELVRFGIGATPSFFINGRFMSGAMPIDHFTALIDEELAKAYERVKTGTPRAAYYKLWVLDRGDRALIKP